MNIKGHGNKYLVSNLGRVKRLSTVEKWGTKGKRVIPEKIKVPAKTNGYYRVTISHKKVTNICIHRLVAEYFVKGKSQKRYQVNHKDGVKTNNEASNLEWCTPKENINHAQKLGLIKRCTWKLVDGKRQVTWY